MIVTKKLLHNIFVKYKNSIDNYLLHLLFSVRNIVSFPFKKLEKAMTKKNVNCCNNYSCDNNEEQAIHDLFWHFRDTIFSIIDNSLGYFRCKRRILWQSYTQARLNERASDNLQVALFSVGSCICNRCMFKDNSFKPLERIKPK